MDTLPQGNPIPPEPAVVNAAKLDRRFLWGVVWAFVFSLFLDIALGWWDTRDEPQGWAGAHLILDMTITPFQRMDSLNALLDSMDDIKACDAARVALQANRHVQLDSSTQSVVPFLTLCTASVRTPELLADARGQVSLGLVSAGRELGRTWFLHTLFSAKYLRAWEASVKDASPVVRNLRRVVQVVDYASFRDLGRKGVQGKQGWVFYRPGIDYQNRAHVLDPMSKATDANDTLPPGSPLPAIVSFRDQLKLRGIDLLVVVVPNKESVYPDVLAGPSAAGLAGKLPHTRRFFQLFDSLGISYVDLFTTMAKAREQDSASGDSLYLKTDTHWRPRGASLAADAVSQRIRSYPWYASPHDTAEFQFESVEVDRHGDILGMTQLAGLPIGEGSLEFPSEKVMARKVCQVVRDSVGTVVSRTPFRDEYRKSRILLLGDSFSRIYHTDEPQSAGWIEQLALSLGEPLGSIVSEGGASTLVREKLARKSSILKGKKLVVWEFVERDFRYGTDGWKDVVIPQ